MEEIQSTNELHSKTTWEELGLSPAAIETCVRAGFTGPTTVQALSMPHSIKGRDVIVSSQTGSGKTAAFVLPMVEKFAGREGTYGLILAPTREIAIQIEQTIKILGEPRGVRSIVMIGGVDYKVDEAALNTYPQIIVATPGRLCDHLDRGNIWLEYIEILVLDEADRMLDMGFADQLSRITEDTPSSKQTLLFSATIPKEVRKLAQKTLKDPEEISIGRPLSAAQTIEQRLIWVKEDKKSSALRQILREEPGSVIVFTKSKDGATKVWRALHSAGFYDATYIHSDRPQAHREQALTQFKSGEFRILIATDVAGRGIHVENVAHVVNYDMPMDPEEYVHRIGRTGRIGNSGRATTLAGPRDQGMVDRIEKLIGKSIPVIELGRSPRREVPRGESLERENTPERVESLEMRAVETESLVTGDFGATSAESDSTAPSENAEPTETPRKFVFKPRAQVEAERAEREAQAIARGETLVEAAAEPDSDDDSEDEEGSSFEDRGDDEGSDRDAPAPFVPKPLIKRRKIIPPEGPVTMLTVLERLYEEKKAAGLLEDDAVVFESSEHSLGGGRGRDRDRGRKRRRRR